MISYIDLYSTMLFSIFVYFLLLMLLPHTGDIFCFVLFYFYDKFVFFSCFINLVLVLLINIVYYSHFIGHLLSRYRRISDCLYSIVYGQAGRYAPYRPA